MLEELKRRKELQKKKEEEEIKLQRKRSEEAEINRQAAEGVRKRKEAAAEAEAPKPYTAEDAKVVREILNAKDYYQMIGVEKSFTENDLKKAYRKKALKLHPDRNNAPGSKDAFQKINAAMECLSDPQKKRVYDQVGNADAYQRRES